MGAGPATVTLHVMSIERLALPLPGALPAVAARPAVEVEPAPAQRELPKVAKGTAAIGERVDRALAALDFASHRLLTVHFSGDRNVPVVLGPAGVFIVMEDQSSRPYRMDKQDYLRQGRRLVVGPVGDAAGIVTEVRRRLSRSGINVPVRSVFVMTGTRSRQQTIDMGDLVILDPPHLAGFIRRRTSRLIMELAAVTSALGVASQHI
jgi:hypothetical protein